MPEIHHQVNFNPEGHALVGGHHDAAMQATIEARVAERPVAEAAFQSVIDQESLNSKYAQQIADVNTYFASRDLQISPVVVVTQDTMTKAFGAAGEHPTKDAESVDGRSIHGRALVVENQEAIDILGDDFILGIALHEAAHSTGEDGVITTTRETVISNENGRRPVRVLLGGVASGGFIKADLRRDTPNEHVGDFWEESFADLTRVKGLRYLGRSHNIKGDSKPLEMDDVAVTVVPNGTSTVQNGADRAGVVIPAEFGFGAMTTPEGRDRVGVSPANLAAYALELLDSHVPGLYEDMEASRGDPRRQAEAIRKIESVQPGLYRQLRDLEYDTPDFARGLAMIVEATSPVLVTK